ncbi:MAG: hypothetical protein JRC68_02620, partial [Deltaproteobacteria bacterium]|nr:hypothetical protein [Deltaproteobacteria bacterium]
MAAIEERLEGTIRSRNIMVEIAIPLPGILAKLGWSRRKFFYKRPELEDSGVIFYRREG